MVGFLGPQIAAGLFEAGLRIIRTIGLETVDVVLVALLFEAPCHAPGEESC